MTAKSEQGQAHRSRRGGVNPIAGSPQGYIERRSSRGEIFRRMLQHPRYLFRPWIPIVKAVEGEVFARQRLLPPVLDVACGDGIFAWATYGGALDVGVDLDARELPEAARLAGCREDLMRQRVSRGLKRLARDLAVLRDDPEEHDDRRV